MQIVQFCELFARNISTYFVDILNQFSPSLSNLLSQLLPPYIDLPQKGFHQLIKLFGNSNIDLNLYSLNAYATGICTLKTYAKFTFCIKSQGHVFVENFLCHCMHQASKISSCGVRNI